MEFPEVVRKRRMVRNYKPSPVGPGTLERILELAQHAPSAGFSQGVSYVVVTDSEVKRKVAELQGEGSYGAAGFHPWISRAPIAIVVCTSEKVYHDRYREKDKLKDDGTEIEWPTPYWFFDAGCSSMILLLAAVNEGLAASFTGVPDVDGMRDALGIPDEFHPVGVVSIGVPDSDVKSPSLKRGRKPSEDVIHRNKW